MATHRANLGRHVGHGTQAQRSVVTRQVGVIRSATGGSSAAQLCIASGRSNITDLNSNQRNVLERERLKTSVIGVVKGTSGGHRDTLVILREGTSYQIAGVAKDGSHIRIEDHTRYSTGDALARGLLGHGAHETHVRRLRAELAKLGVIEAHGSVSGTAYGGYANPGSPAAFSGGGGRSRGQVSGPSTGRPPDFRGAPTTPIAATAADQRGGRTVRPASAAHRPAQPGGTHHTPERMRDWTIRAWQREIGNDGARITLTEVSRKGFRVAEGQLWWFTQRASAIRDPEVRRAMDRANKDSHTMLARAWPRTDGTVSVAFFCLTGSLSDISLADLKELDRDLLKSAKLRAQH